MRATVFVCEGAPSSVLAPHLVEYEARVVLGLRALEEEGDLGVGRVREHVEEAAFDGAERGHGRQVLGQ